MRRYSREAGRWAVVLETREGQLPRLPLIDLSPGGARVRLTERLTEGTRGRVYFLPAHWHPRVVGAIVWRIHLDGIVLRDSMGRAHIALDKAGSRLNWIRETEPRGERMLRQGLENLPNCGGGRRVRRICPYRQRHIGPAH